MNVYKSIGYAVGTPEALALAARLSAWHDAMVAHQRPADTARVTRCDDECPHAEARSLWREAADVFGRHAEQMGFLRRHGSSDTDMAPSLEKSEIVELLARVQSEYREMPGLTLTVSQAERLWRLDPSTCALVLRLLSERRVLRRSTSGRYLRGSAY